MQFSDFLQTISEVSATFAGFTAIIIAFQSQSDWGASERIVIIHFLQLALGVVMLALFPIALSSVASMEPYVWRCSNGVLGTFHLSVLAWIFIRRKESAPQIQLALLPGLLSFFAVLGLSSLLLNFAVAIGFFPSLQIFAYLVGLLWLLGMALVNFVGFLLHRFKAD